MTAAARKIADAEIIEAAEVEVGDEVRAIAIELLDQLGSSEAATEALYKRAQASDDLYRELTKNALRESCRRVIGDVIRKTRSGAWDGQTRNLSKDQVAAWGQAVAYSLLDDFKLPGGKSLGDALKEDVTAAAHGYSAQANDMTIKAKWLSAIAKGLPAKKRVRDYYNEARLQELRDSARKIDEVA